MKKYLIFLVLIELLFFTSINAQKKGSAKTKTKQKSLVKKSPQLKKSPQKTGQQNSAFNPEITWTGTISFVEKYSGLIGTSERHIDLSFVNVLPTLNRNIETTNFDFTDDKGKGSVKDHVEMKSESGRSEEKGLGTCDCSGEGEAELHEVVVDRIDSTYRIHAIGPPCKGGTASDGSCAGSDLWDVIVSDHPIVSNPFHLEGTETMERDITIGKVTTTITWNLKGCPPWNDPQTRMIKLEATVKAAAARFIKRVHDELCIKLKVANGLRTIEEQDNLYATGRTLPGNIVTWAEGGESYHNYGLAIDVYIVKDNGTLDFDTRIPPEVAKIGKEEGFAWGGDWAKKKRDYPHFEKTLGQTIKELKLQNGIR